MKACVLISTYNGSKYIQQQLKSLVEQDFQGELIIQMRDDTSKDNTADIVEKFIADYKGPVRFSFVRDHHMGLTLGYLKLVKEAVDADYYFFCDHDDYWLPDKISQSIKALNTLSESKPRLYVGNYNIVDSELKYISTPQVERKVDLKQALVENIATGCTMAFDRKFRELFLKNVPEKVVIHDWYFYLLGVVYGQIYIDSKAYINYRQHGVNAVGATQSFMSKLRFRLKLLKSWAHDVKKQSVELLNYPEDANGNSRETIKKFLQPASVFRNIKYFVNPPVRRSKLADEIPMRVMFLLGIL